MYISQKEVRNNPGPMNFHKKFDQAYYNYLLKQHNYIDDLPTEKENFEDNIKMEHSYTRDRQPSESAEVMATRTILIERPPQCPSCHSMPNHEEKVDIPEVSNTTSLPKYDEESGRLALDEIQHIITHCKNNNPDDEIWVEKINKFGWTEQQQTFFNRIERILDLDRMAQLAITDRTNECLRHRAVTEKSVSRMRSALSSVRWEQSLTQWLHGLLVKHLPPSYMASYITILQGLKAKVPTLVDKMLFSRPLGLHQDYLSFILKQPWEPDIPTKSRVLPSNTTIIIVPSSPVMHTPLRRLQRWYQLLAAMAKVVPIQVNISHSVLQKQSLDQVTDQMVAITRAKIQEVRCESPQDNIILLGISGGAAIALQVALVEEVNSIVCLGFAYNTMKGTRGAQDDRILELTTPVLFILGQNAQRSSQEEIESLREHMSAQTSLVVIGSADDLLKVDKSKEHLEGATQSMIDNMIADEIQEFTNTCIRSPPGPREPNTLNTKRNGYSSKSVLLSSTKINSSAATKRPKLTNEYEDFPIQKKFKAGQTSYHPIIEKRKTMKRAKNTSSMIGDLMSSDDILTMQPINGYQNGPHIISSYEIIASGDQAANIQTTQSLSNHPNDDTSHKNITLLPASRPNITQKVKFVPSNEFVHIKPPPVNTQKIYIKTPSNGTTTMDSYTLGVSPLVYDEDSISGNIATNKLMTVKKMYENYSETMKLENRAITKNGLTFAPNKGKTANDSDLYEANILDIPILFADSEGNFDDNILMDEVDTDTFHLTTAEPRNTENQLFANGHADIASEESEDVDILTPATNDLPKEPKTVTTKKNVVILNGTKLNQYSSTLKPLSNSVRPSKYTKVIVPVNQNGSLPKLPVSSGKALVPGRKINLSTLMKYGRKQQTMQILPTSLPSATVTSSAYQTTLSSSSSSPNIFRSDRFSKNTETAVYLNANGNHEPYKNIIKLHPSDRIKFGKTNGSNNNNHIVIQQNNFRKISTLEPGLINRNMTVRKINVVKKPAIEIQSIVRLDNFNEGTDEVEILEAAESLLESVDDELEYNGENGEVYLA